METVWNSQVLIVMMTIGVFLASGYLYSRTSFFLFHPVLVTVAATIVYIELHGIEYRDYSEKSKIISFFLEPSVVALGLPLYLQIEKVKKRFSAIGLSVLAGCVTGIVTVVVIALLFGGTEKTALSLAPKSVTTPIAMGISSEIGGIPALTAVIVVSVGIFGAAVGLPFMKLARIKHPEAIGIAMGTSAHAVGTSRVTLLGENYGAFSGLGLALNGVATAIVAPWIIKLII